MQRVGIHIRRLDAGCQDDEFGVCVAVAIVFTAAMPTCLLGAWGYTTLSGRGVMIVIGSMMVASVPLRRFALRRGFKLSDGALASAAAGWGVIVGGTTGAGVLLLSMLLAAGLQGASVIATDAAISIAIGIVKVAVFGVAGVVGAKVIAVRGSDRAGGFSGCVPRQGLVDKLPLRAHVTILDTVVAIGGAMLILEQSCPRGTQLVRPAPPAYGGAALRSRRTLLALSVPPR